MALTSVFLSIERFSHLVNHVERHAGKSTSRNWKTFNLFYWTASKLLMCLGGPAPKKKITDIQAIRPTGVATGFAF